MINLWHGTVTHSILQNLVCTTLTEVFLNKKATRKDETEKTEEWVSLPHLGVKVKDFIKSTTNRLLQNFKEKVTISCMLLSCHVRVSEGIYTLHFVWMSKNSLFEVGAISEVQMTATRFEPTTTSFLKECSTI